VNKRLATIAFIMFLCFTSAAYAATTIYSNITTDVVTEYVLGTMTKDTTGGIKYTNVTFTGQLLLGAVGVSGKTVYLLCNSTGTWTPVVGASSITDATGHYFFTVNRTESGTFYYKAGFDVP
jgi:hypothetical protein